ncbi:MAG: putative bifunctional diguanylate cyclase/phosphodiesterase [Candidatus Dormibacteria bacterium]
MSPPMVTAKQGSDDARAGPENRPEASAGSVAPIWVLNVVMMLAAAAVYLFAVAPLRIGGGAAILPIAVLVTAFAVGEWWRVYIHFRQEAQSFSLSEIPLVIGVFVLAANPGPLVLARILGGAIGLGVLRRQEPMKLIFNLASFALETETVTILVHHISGTDATSPVVWLWVLLFMSLASLLGFGLTALAISLAEGRQSHRQWLQPIVIVLIGGFANCSLGLVVVALLKSDPPMLLLLLTPLAAIGASYVLYTREHQKHQRLQYLYESSDMLQRASSDGAAIPELLDQLCKVFRADIAVVSLLPVASGSGAWRTISTSSDATDNVETVLSAEHLERFVPLLDETKRGLIVTPSTSDPELRTWLREQGFRDAMATLLQGEGMLLGTLVVANRLSDVGTFDNEDLHLFDAFAAQTSVAVQNTRLGHRLRQQAFHDTLTDLANRALFMDRLEHALTRRERHDESLAVMFLDLDDFKEINDSLGHMAGDELLARVADRLKLVLRASDTAARFGGDEFAILVEETADPEDTIRVAERIVSVFKPRFVIAGREVTISASVGVAVTASRDVTAEELVGRADVAMYRAKVKGKDTYEIFEPGMQDVVARRLEVRTDLERAIDRHELVVLYQPIVDMTTSTPVGVEALVRWKHPRWGMVVPAEFIGIAEETGMIRELGLHVLEEACRQWQEWQVELNDEPGFTVSVNVSPRQLRDPGFVSEVWRILTKAGVPPSHLTLEITESFMVDDPESARARLRELKSLGIRISMDDFGTGYSSLASLQDLPLDILKIDKLFVDHVAEDPRRTAFAQAIIRMGKTLGLGLIAEGVETADQAERLLSLGCRLAQGFYFSRPVPADEIKRMLHASHAMRLAGGRWAPAEPVERRAFLRVLEETA